MIRREFQKIFSSKVLWLLLIGLLLVNGYVQIDKTHARYYTPENYRDFFSEIAGQTPYETDIFLAEKTENINKGNIEDYPMVLVYDMQEISAELRDYPDYLLSIFDNAKVMEAANIWGETNTFSYRNIQKTPLAYENITETNLLPLQPSLGIEDATNGKITSIFGIFLVFLFTSMIFLQDREQEILPLLYSTKNGRWKLCSVKFFTASICSVALAILFFLENFIIGGVLYGVGDLSRPMQTIYGFYTANLPISVGLYLLLYCVIQMFAYLVFSSIFALICTIAKNNITIYGLSAGVSLMWVLCYQMIPTYSPIALLHYWNPIQLLHSNEIFADYVNVNFFGFPISSKISILILTAVLISICFVCSNVLFSISRNLQYKRIGRIKRKTNCIHSRFYYICHRYLVLNHGFVLIIALIGVSAFCSANLVRTYNNDDIYYENFTTDFTGNITKDTQQFIKDKFAHYDDIQKKIDKLESDGNGSLFLLNKLYAEFNDRQAFERFAKRVSKIEHNSDAEIFYDTGYEHFFGIDGNLENQWIMLAILLFLTLLIPSVPAIDRKTYAMRFIRASKSGKKGYRTDILIFSVLAGVFSTAITMIPYTLRILQCYGIQGLNAPICSIAGFAKFPVNISVLAMIILWILTYMLISIIVAILCAGISTKLRSPIKTYVICAGVFVLPILVALMVR